MHLMGQVVVYVARLEEALPKARRAVSELHRT